LGRWGIPVNLIALLYSYFVFFWMFWPTSTPLVGAASMNRAIVMFFGVLAVAMAFFLIKARHSYYGPVVKTEGYKA
jgi:choline transport protein